MRYIIYLILIITCMLFAESTLAENDRYRVEVIVLSHLHHAETPRDIKWLEDFSTTLDFLTPLPEQEDEAEDELSTADTAEADLLTADALLTDEQPEDPNAVVHIEEMSPLMQETWRRMRLSAPFRPEQYLSWEQGSEAPFPVLRLHDLDAVMVDDPYFAQRQAMEEAATLLAESGAMAVKESEEDPTNLLPEPTFYYRLDGSVMLKRTRFLHLDIKLQMREAVFEEKMPADLAQAVPATEPATGELPPPKPSSFLVFNLQQSRQVKTGRMEYFDNPVLGVLAFISKIEPEQTQD